jgi:head-tail adaptor
VKAGALVHARMLPALERSGVFPLKVAIQQRTATRTASGAEIPTWTDVAGMSKIPCRRGQPGGMEIRQSEMTVEHLIVRLALNGYYPTITQKMRAVVGAATYDITAIQADSQQTWTLLDCRLVNPVAEAGL